jgi:hypothetical protein
MLVCGGLAVASLWQALDAPPGVPRLLAWLLFVLAATGAVVLFAIGLMRNTRDAIAARDEPVAEPPSAFFPMAPDPSLARDAARLLATPVDERAADWERDFYGTAAAAALAPVDPAQFTGPDGFPYAAFRLDESSGAQLSLTTVAETLIDRGMGVALNPRADQSADWVFSCGDLLSLRLYGQIAVAPAVAEAVTKTEHEVLVASPSDALLPAATRAALRRFMRETLGIANPSVFLIVDAAVQPPESLVFNVAGQALAAGWTEEGAVRYLHWFLPRHYRTITVPADSSLARHFQPL